MIIGTKIIFHENLPSTNDYAIQFLKDNKPTEGTVIRTSHQSDGRGQGSNKWESEKDKNLLLSIIVYPSFMPAGEQFFLSMAVSLGICDLLSGYFSGISVKWPNDIYVNNDKIAGVLIENSVMGDCIEYSVIGTGLNVNQDKFISDAPNPVSMKNITGQVYDLEDVLQKLMECLDKRYKMLIAGEFDVIKNDYLRILYRKGIWSRYSDSRGEFEGRLSDVAGNGTLTVEKKGGEIKAYSFKEIEFIQ
jgi:BirA family transcriptional regulator, biotin operon repressor / biotin---[acetyl-CoA-carboxylase] ligase